MQWVDMQKYSDKLVNRNTSDERLTEALSRPGLYVVRFNNLHGTHVDVIKLGRTDITDEAKLRNRMNDYHGANAFSFRIVAFGLTRRRKFPNQKSKEANSIRSIVNEAENDMREFVNKVHKTQLVSYPAQRKEFFFGSPSVVDQIEERMVSALKHNYNVHDILIFNQNGIKEHWHNFQLDIPWSEAMGKREGTARPIVASVRKGDEPNFKKVGGPIAVSTRSMGLFDYPESLKLLKKAPIRGGYFRILK